ncbi:DoxX family protein [Haloechinothrix halophila]|uniref:DoxX family protein n=1 Tax=Haloechinothrix halophila TaxID=1069073 RepID=UPI000414A54C|nr:membrane protein [Haloechinothrix halophila]
MDNKDSRLALTLALLLGGVGTLHFAVPKFFDALIPRALPGSPRAWTYGSGVAELGCAAAVAMPRTRRIGATLAALLFIAVFPGNVKMAVDYHRTQKPLPMRVGTLLRLPLQVPLVLWALRIRNRA